MISLSGWTSAIGVDFGVRRIRALQVRRKGGKWHLHAAAAYNRSGSRVLPDAREISHLREVLGRQGFAGNEIVTAVPGDALLTGILELPPSDSEAPREQIARAELARIHEIDPGVFEMSCWDLPRGVQARETNYVMAAGYAHTTADPLLDACEDGGLEVRALDVRGCAIARACESWLDDAGKVYGLLDTRWSQATLSMVSQGVIVYERNIACGGLSGLYESLNKQLGFEGETTRRLLRELDLSDPAQASGELGEVHDLVLNYVEDLAAECRTPFAYVQHEYHDAQAGGLIVAGEAGTFRGISGTLGEMLDMQVSRADPRELLECPAALAEMCGADQAAALGFARFTER